MATEKDLENRKTIIWKPGQGDLQEFRVCGVNFSYKYFIIGFRDVGKPEIAAICKNDEELAETFCDFSKLRFFCGVERYYPYSPLPKG